MRIQNYKLGRVQAKWSAFSSAELGMHLKLESDGKSS